MSLQELEGNVLIGVLNQFIGGFYFMQPDRETLLAEYEVCAMDVSQLDNDIWQAGNKRSYRTISDWVHPLDANAG